MHVQTPGGHRGQRGAEQPRQRVHERGEGVAPFLVGHVRGGGGRRRHSEVGQQDVDRPGRGHGGSGRVWVDQRVGAGDHGGAVPGEDVAQDGTHEDIGLGDQDALACEALVC